MAQTSLTPESRAALARVLGPQSDRIATAKAQPFTLRVARDAYSRFMSWNEIALEVTAADHARGPVDGYDQLGPHRASRAMAIVHLAMYDAVNSISRKYRLYSAVPDADPDACLDAAISEAARNSLLAMFPRETARINDAYDRDAPWATAACNSVRLKVDKGKAAGAAAAKAILDLRINDGSKFDERDAGTEQQAKDQPDKYIFFPAGLGKWQPDPVSKIPVALGYDWGKVKPFVITAVDGYLPGPRDIGSPEYAAQFREVESLGAANSMTRKESETFSGIFWAYDGTPALCAPPRLYNQFALQVVEQNQLPASPIADVSDLARFLALLNVAMADAGIAAWKAKWDYSFWRPITAITYAGDDGNPGTTPRADFVPLGAPATNGRGPNFTPPFPAYPSGHAVFGGAVFEVLRAFFPENTSVKFVSDEFNGLNKDPITGISRDYRPKDYFNFSQAEWENARSRIWLGIHWQMDADDGVAMGNKIAQAVLKGALLPR
ncbi:vanadium-dependent haloperoxidase [Dongia sp. agr-C8]